MEAGNLFRNSVRCQRSGGMNPRSQKSEMRRRDRRVAIVEGVSDDCLAAVRVLTQRGKIEVPSPLHPDPENPRFHSERWS